MVSLNLNIIKEQYQNLSDDELIRFAKNESEHLTMESFHLLISEFESRDLDIGVIESAQIDKELADVTKITEFEKITAFVYTETIWKFAFEEKKKGIGNEELFSALLKKNISPEYAYMLIESIELRTKELLEDTDTEVIAGWVTLFIGITGIFFTLNSSIATIFSIVGPVLILGAIIGLFRSYSKKIKYKTIIRNIEIEKTIQ